MHIHFSGVIFYWRGPSPYYFIAVPEPESRNLKGISPFVSYGWGVIPVRARIGETDFQTSLIPRRGGYLLPLKDRLREAEGLELDDEVAVQLWVDL